MGGYEASADPPRRWLPAALALGVLYALPVLVCRYLPLVDFPMHQLELAVWLEPERAATDFARWYEVSSFSIPYWSTFWLGRLLALLFDVELSSRLLVALYLVALPGVACALASAAGRHPIWGLSAVPFAFELNLAYGFVPYCWGILLWVAALALALHIERSERPLPALAGLVLLGAVLGWTHPQAGPMATLSILGLQLLRRGPRRGVLCAVALVPLWADLVWYLHGASAERSFSGAPRFASFPDQLRDLLRWSVDVFPEFTEELLLGGMLLLLGLQWRGQHRPDLRWWRPMLIALAALLGYFVLPFDYNGQAICQRMLLPALLLLPLWAPVGRVPSKLATLLLVGAGAVGALNAGVHIWGFHAETSETLEPIIAATPAQPRLAYAAHALDSPWVNAPAYLHAGAWVTLRRGGVYAFNFDRLTISLRDRVPRTQRMHGREFAFSRYLARHGRVLIAPRAQLDFYDTYLIRWPLPGVPPAPREFGPDEVTSALRSGPWALLITRTK